MYLRHVCVQTLDNGHSYLSVDSHVDCNASDRSFYLTWATAFAILFPLGIPLVYIVLLWRQRALLNPEMAAADTMEEVCSHYEVYGGWVGGCGCIVSPIHDRTRPRVS
jgi:hypothetical protein